MVLMESMDLSTSENFYCHLLQLLRINK